MSGSPLPLWKKAFFWKYERGKETFVALFCIHFIVPFRLGTEVYFECSLSVSSFASRKHSGAENHHFS